MLLVKSVIPFVFPTVLPDIVTVAMHDSTLELTLEVTSIGPLETTMATHLIISPSACVLAAVGPKVASFAFLDAAKEVSMVVATITPHLNAFSILLVLLAARDIRLRVHVVQIFLNVEVCTLTENTEICLAVLLPEALICLHAWFRCAEYTNSTSLPIDPVTFKRAAIRPDEFAVATLSKLVVNDLVTLARRELVVSRSGSLLNRTFVHFRVDGGHSNLSHILQRADLHRFELQLSILHTKLLILFC